MKKIRIFSTGGTFDKEYNLMDGSLYFKDTHLPEILKKGRSTLEVEFRNLMMVDSLEMTQNDREIILKSCERDGAERIIITHGTDTMTETAHFIAEAKLNKTIILTGAMIPYAFGSSDGLFNLGSSLAFVQTLPFGVYIAMNGRYFEWDKVRKNKATGFFEEI